MFFEHPITRAIPLIDIRSDRRKRRISAQSSTLNTHFLLTSAEVSISEGVSFQLPLGGQFSRAVDRGMIRLVKLAKNVAVKARTSALICLKAVLVNAPGELREQLER